MTVKSTSRARIAIVGGGMAGLACALEFSRRGAAPEVFEAGLAGQGALWASGGMLAGVFESAELQAGEAVSSLARSGLELWRDWSFLLGREAIGYRAAGSLSPAIGRDEKTWLERLEASARAQGFRADRIAIPDGMAADAAVHFPDDGELDNRLLGARLIELLRSRDVTIREHCAVAAIEALSDGSVRLTANGEHRSFDAVILATGNDDRLGEVDPALAARVPVKGEMLAVAAKGVCLPYCVRGQSVYLSQKPDGRIVIGATSQVGARDVVVDNAAIDELRRRAERFLPALAGLAEMERWAGIRPGTRDGQPIIGECRMPGVFLALGLYRNGVLFSPAAAEIIADAVLSGQQTPLAFSPRRFDER